MAEVASLRETDRFPVRKPWDSLDLLRDVERADLEASPRDMAEVAELLLFDMNTEYDAMNLSDYLDRRQAAGTEFSPEFWQFREAWLADEWNHYRGYRKLYSLCTGKSAEALHEDVVSRPVDFGPVERFLDDEFWICLVIAYDEIFTVRSCQQDFPLFESFAKPCLLEWIKLVARDEGYHYRNALEVVRRRHRDRIAEAPQVLDTLIGWDSESKEYGATFVLDHEETRYDAALLQTIREKILSLLDRRD